MNRLPVWFRQDIPDAATLKMLNLLSEFGLNSVCQEAKCPNITDCFKNNRVTFMILGERCSRNCRFCGVAESKAAVLAVDKDEPYRIAEVVKILGLSYAVITSVTRDDLPDGGASQFAKTLELIHSLNPVRNTMQADNNKIVSNGVKIEVLIPDFQGKISSLETVLTAGPDCLGHNMETVSRLYPQIRPQANYRLSLNILRKTKEINPQMNTKSSIMLGLGETQDEVIRTMEDLKKHQCDILTLGQYLAPSAKHYPVKEFISIEQFREYQEIGIDMGFKVVFSGPKVRSSYQAEQLVSEIATC